MKKNSFTQQKINILPIQLLIAVGPFLVGLFYEFACALVSAYLIGCLWSCAVKNKGLKFVLNDSTIAVFAVVFFYALSASWAVDKGMAVFGFVKFFPILPFSLLVMQLAGEDKKKIIGVIPVSGIAMTILAYILSFVNPLKEFLLVDYRLSGFFQYPNVFALFLLLGIVIIVTGEKFTRKSLLYIVILLFGIFVSGSRIVFGVLLMMIIIILVTGKNKKLKIALASMMVLGLAVSLAYVTVTKNFATIGRYLTSLSDSETLILRIFYLKDALPVIKSNLFGLGYLGYYYSHHSFQTGVYSIMYIHNEFFQMILDIGIVPAVLFVFALIKSFFFKKNSLQNRLIMLAIMMHSFFDFDLQYISIFLILILTLDFESQKSYNVVKYKRLAQVGSVLIVLICLYFSVSNYLYYIRADSAALKIYPFNTQAQMKLLRNETDMVKAGKIADDILNHNTHIPLTYSTKAAVAYANGNIAEMIDCQKNALLNAKYDLNLYIEYFEMLKNAVELYNAAGDYKSAGYCVQELKAIPEMLNEIKEKTDALAWKTADKPNLELPEKYLVYIASLSL